MNRSTVARALRDLARAAETIADELSPRQATTPPAQVDDDEAVAGMVARYEGIRASRAAVAAEELRDAQATGKVVSITKKGRT